MAGKNFFQRNAQKITALLFWVGLIALYQWYAGANDLSPVEVSGGCWSSCRMAYGVS